jgi:hypothetical protein
MTSTGYCQEKYPSDVSIARHQAGVAAVDVKQDDLARRAFLEVNIGGHDATSFLEPYLVSFEYTDHAAGKSDEISIELHDRDCKWLEGWLPSKGTGITARIRCLNWRGPGMHMALACGSFTCDEASWSGPPGKVSIKGVSASLTGPLRARVFWMMKNFRLRRKGVTRKPLLPVPPIR